MAKRVSPDFDALIEKAAEAQRVLLASPTSDAGVFSLMWKNGVHPLQDEEPIDHELPSRDAYDQLTALMEVTGAVMGDDALARRYSSLVTRLRSMLGFMVRELQLRLRPGGRSEDRVALAARWRAEDTIGRLFRERAGLVHSPTSR